MDDPLEIKPNRLYKAEEAAELLGFRGKISSLRARMYRIKPTDLTRTRLGPKGGAIRFLGADLLAYIAARRSNR